MNNSANSFEINNEFQYVTRKNKGRKKRKSRPNVRVNAEQNSENSDVIENEPEDKPSSEFDDTNECGESDFVNDLEHFDIDDRISTDAQLQAKPNYEPEELSNEKVEQIYEDEKEPPTAESIFEPGKVTVQEYNVRALSKHAETYELEKFEKKALLIFNQENVEGFIPRYGTEKDVEAIKNTFERFGFEVTEYKDFTKKEIFDRLEAFSIQDFTDYGCIGIAVLTHGSNYGLLRAKDQQYSEIEIINLFKVHDKPTLVTKPKFLIVQACRGTNIIPGAPVLHSGRKIRTDVDDSKEPYILPVEADMLILHSSYVGSPSHRDELTGTWFIQSLCKKTNQLAATHDLESIITVVKRDVAIDKEHEVYNRRTLEIQVNKQMPVMTSTLIRKLYLRKFGDSPLLPLIRVSDSLPSASPNASNEVLDFASTSPMLVQFGPCSCFLGHFEYMKNCLRFFVEENPDDITAHSYLEVAEEFEDGVKFNAAKEKLAKAMCKHLIINAKHCDYYKYLYFYKHF